MELLIPLIISAVTFILRVVNLLNIPIFTDEAIYIRWAQVGLNDPAQRYISLTDGKQPLLTWLMYPTLKIFSDPLFAGRFVSVLSGVFAALGIYFLARELFGRKTAVIASIIYIFSPFALLYDRLALYDSLLAGFGVWCLYLSVLLVRRLRLDTALLLGMTAGLGVLTKSSAWIYLMLSPFSIILFDFKSKKKVKRLFIWLGFLTVSTAIAEVMYNSLRLSPWFYLIRQKNYSFIMTPAEFLKKPFELFFPNLNGLMSFLIPYLTLPILLVILIGLVMAVVRKDTKIIYLFLWFIVPFLSLGVIGVVIFPRFILFMVMPLFIIAASVISDLTVILRKQTVLLIFIIAAIFVYPVYQSFLIITFPVEAAIPTNDRNQLFNDWPSGYGTREVIAYLTEKAKSGKIVVGTEGTFGLNPAVYEIYLKTNKNVEILGFWPVGEIPAVLLISAQKYPTYLIFKDTQKVPDNWPLKLIGKYRRGNGNTFLLFYQVLPQKS